MRCPRLGCSIADSNRVALSQLLGWCWWRWCRSFAAEPVMEDVLPAEDEVEAEAEAEPLDAARLQLV